MKTLTVGLASLLLSIPAFADAPEQNQIRFRYVPSEGVASVACTHERIRDLPDWRVTCPFFGQEKEFTAHVVLRAISKRESRNAYELLYWVTEPGENPRGSKKFHSTSALLGFKGKAHLADLSIGQGVENDYASLQLEATLETGKR